MPPASENVLSSSKEATESDCAANAAMADSDSELGAANEELGGTRLIAITIAFMLSILMIALDQDIICMFDGKR